MSETLDRTRKLLASDANIDEAAEAVRALLYSFSGALGIVRNTVAAFRLAGYNDTDEGLYMPDLMEAIGRLLPDEEAFHDKVSGTVQSFKSALLDAQALAGAVPPALLTKVIRAANGEGLGREHVGQLRSVAEQLAALSSHHPDYMDAYGAYVEALNRLGWNCEPTIKGGRVSLEFGPSGARPYNRPPVAQAKAPKKGRGGAKT